MVTIFVDKEKLNGGSLQSLLNSEKKELTNDLYNPAEALDAYKSEELCALFDNIVYSRLNEQILVQKGEPIEDRNGDLVQQALLLPKGFLDERFSKYSKTDLSRLEDIYMSFALFVERFNEIWPELRTKHKQLDKAFESINESEKRIPDIEEKIKNLHKNGKNQIEKRKKAHQANLDQAKSNIEKQSKRVSQLEGQIASLKRNPALNFYFTKALHALESEATLQEAFHAFGERLGLEVISEVPISVLDSGLAESVRKKINNSIHADKEVTYIFGERHKEPEVVYVKKKSKLAWIATGVSITALIGAIGFHILSRGPPDAVVEKKENIVYKEHFKADIVNQHLSCNNTFDNWSNRTVGENDRFEYKGIINADTLDDFVKQLSNYSLQPSKDLKKKEEYEQYVGKTLFVIKDKRSYKKHFFVVPDTANPDKISSRETHIDLDFGDVRVPASINAWKEIPCTEVSEGEVSRFVEKKPVLRYSLNIRYNRGNVKIIFNNEMQEKIEQYDRIVVDSGRLNPIFEQLISKNTEGEHMRFDSVNIPISEPEYKVNPYVTVRIYGIKVSENSSHNPNPTVQQKDLLHEKTYYPNFTFKPIQSDTVLKSVELLK